MSPISSADKLLDLSTLQVSPLLLQLLTLTGGQASAPTATTPATGSIQLQSFLNAIPVANDGDVIRADHFNAIRSALAQLAAALDVDQLSRVVAPVFTPTLLPIAGAEAAAWRTEIGYAVGPSSGSVAKGWMPIDLPNQAAIDSLTIRARMPQAPKMWKVELRRQEVVGSGTTTICLKDINAEPVAADGTLTVTLPVLSEGITAAQLADRRLIDTTAYRYQIATEVAQAQQLSSLEIRSFTVTCTRS